MPLILKPQGKGKLSKRDGEKFGFPVYPIKWVSNKNEMPGYKELGFLPDALVNFLALLVFITGVIHSIFPWIFVFTPYKLAKKIVDGTEKQFGSDNKRRN